MERFIATDRDGDVVALRVPTTADLRCLRRREDEVRALSRRVGGATLGTDEGLVVPSAPVWVLRSSRCAQGECLCQLVDLSVVLDGLGHGERGAAVSAHLGVMGEVSTHQRAVSGVLAGLSDLGAVCAECVLRPQDHLRALDDELDGLSRELAAAVATYRFEVTSLPAG